MASEPLAQRRGDVDGPGVGGELGGGIDDGEQAHLVEPAQADGLGESLLEQVAEPRDVGRDGRDAILPAAPDHPERVVAHAVVSPAGPSPSVAPSSLRTCRTLRMP